jgi:hypothetical protein
MLQDGWSNSKDEERTGSGFDKFIIEGYQYPGINHNLDQATRCAQYPWRELAWDQAHCRYLMGIYYGTWPWLREFVNVSRLGLPSIKLWAYDHLCLFAWPIAEERARLEASIKTEQSKANALRNAAARWSRAEQIRLFICAAREAAVQNGQSVEQGSPFGDWVTWAEQQADRLDPLKESPPSIIDKRVRA